MTVMNVDPVEGMVRFFAENLQGQCPNAPSRGDGE